MTMGMNKADKIIASLSAGAGKVIEEADGTQQGAKVHTVGRGSIERELRDAGIIGPGGGLTMTGSIVAGRMRTALLEDLLW